MKKAFSKSLSWLLSVVMIFGMLVVSSVSVSAVSEEERIKQQIVDAYSWARSAYGGSFTNVCPAFVKYNLAALGIVDLNADSDFRGNGNQFVNNIQEGKTSKGYTKTKYYGNDCLSQIINANGGGNVYNIVVSWTHQYGYSNSSPGAGHVCFIHAILNGTVYMSDNYTYAGKSEGSPLIYSLSDFMSRWNGMYGNAINAVHLTNAHVHNYTEYVYNSSAHPHYKCYRCSCGDVQENRNEPTFVDTCAECLLSTKVDVGNKFYANIKNTKYENYISKADGTNELRLQNKNGTAKQLWYFERQSDGAYVITSCYNGNVLEMTNGDRGNSKHVSVQEKFLGEAYQQWYIIPSESGYNLLNKYYINEGWYLDRSAYGDDSGNYVQIYERFEDTSDQTWTIVKDEFSSNLGNHFYCIISNTKYGKAVSKVDDTDEIYLKDFKNTPKQIWYFEQQPDGAYVITSCYDESVLEMTNGERGNAKHISAHDKFSGEAYQQWYLIVSGNGYKLLNKYCIDEGWYFDRSANSDNNGNYIQIYEKYYDESDQVWTIDKENVFSDLGDHFYSVISNTEYGKAVSKIDGIDEIYLQDFNKKSNQVWYFEKQSDNSYVITSCYDGTVLEMTDGKRENYTRISAYTDFSNSMYQQWFLISSGNGYRLLNKYYIDEGWYLDRSVRSDNNGNYIQIYEKYSDAKDQIWSFNKECAFEFLGDSYSDTYTTRHNYIEKIVDPTCTEKGYTIHTCSICEHSYKDTYINALGHDYKLTSEKAATCTTDGEKIYTCSRCGDTKTETAKATGHSYTTKVIAPTCTAKGYTLHTCKNCNDSYKDTYTNALGHDYKLTSEKAATCITDGEKIYTCSRCGDTKTETVKAKGHSYTTKVIAPTCTEKGYTLHTCSKCGDSYKDTYTNATGHKYEETIVAPTTTEQGYTLHTCSVCKHSYKDNYTNMLLSNNSTLSAETIKLGETITATAKATGGTGEYLYQVVYKQTTQSKWTTAQSYKANATVTFKPANAVTYDVCVKVKDSNNTEVKKFFTVKVTSDELKNVSTISAQTINLGSTVTVNAKATGSTGFYTYAVYYKQKAQTKWTTKQDFKANNTIAVKPAKATAYDICVKVKDDKGTIVKKYFTVNVTDFTNTSTLSATEIKLGETIKVNCSATGSTGYYQYAVYYKKTSDTKWTTKQSYSSNNTVTIKPAKATTYDVCVKVKDNQNNEVKKYFTVTVK